MSTYTLYDEFAKIYDEHWAQGYLADAREGLERYFIPRVPPGGRVLDVCCGSGRMARWFADQGFEAVGVDGSGAMIELARLNTPNGEFQVADARDFQLEQPADAALSTFDSINHLETVAEVAQVFQNVSRSLVPGGWFCFDVNTDEGFRANDEEEYFSVDENRAAFVRSRYEAGLQIGKSEVTIFRREGDCWKRSDTLIPEYCHPTAALLEALEGAGFEGATILTADGDWKMPLGEGRLFVMAEKVGA